MLRARHIVTLESPIEYIFNNRQSFIRQREIPTHSPSFDQRCCQKNQTKSRSDTARGNFSDRGPRGRLVPDRVAHRRPGHVGRNG
jgi:hypothetical protein